MPKTCDLRHLEGPKLNQKEEEQMLWPCDTGSTAHKQVSVGLRADPSLVSGLMQLVVASCNQMDRIKMQNRTHG
jgi:hypothetical protein